MDPGSQTPQWANSPRRDALLRRVEAAVARGEIADAARFAEQGLSQGIEHPALLNLVAYQYLRAGALNRALDLLQRARALAPRDPHVLNGLGIVLKRLGRLDEAFAALEAALAADPANVNALFNRGMVLEARDDNAAAWRSYERAVELDPHHEDSLARLSFLAAMRGDFDAALSHGNRALKRYVGESTAELRLAQFMLMRGDFGPALDMAAKAIAREPNNPLAQVAMAHAELGAGRIAETRARTNTLLQHKQLKPDTRAFAHWILAEAADREGDTKDAFAEYTASKDLLKSIYARDFGPPRTPYSAIVARTAEYFRTAPADQWRAPSGPAPAKPHVFILGFTRSGTTLLQHGLAAHPAFITNIEMNPFPEAVDQFFLAPDGWARLAGMQDADLEHYRETYWRLVREAAPAVDGKIYIDKNPLRTAVLGIVAKMFPHAKILFAVRDPRDTVLSSFRQHFAMSLPMYEFCTLEGTARVYDEVMRLADVYREKLPLQIMDVRHEELTADYETTMRRVCAFVGVEWHDAMRDVETASRAKIIKTPTAAQLKGGVAPRESKWPRYRNELAPVLPLLNRWAARFGYPLD